MDIARSSLKIFSAKFGRLFLSFLGIAYFAQQLGAAPLGVYFLFQAVLAVLALPANLGTRIAVEKRISEGGPADQIFGTGVAIKSFLLLFIVVGILIFGPFLAQYIGADVVIYLAISIILHEFAYLLMNVLKGELRVGETATLQLAYVLAWLSTSLILVQMNLGVLGLIYGVIAGKSLQLLWGVYKINTALGMPTVAQASSLVDYAKFSIVPEVDGQVHSWMDVLIIGFFLTQASVSAYEIAWRVAAPVLLLTTAIGTTIFPQISSWESEDAVSSIEKLLPRIITPSLIFVFPAFFGGALLSQEILGLIFGEEFTMAWLALIILLGAKLPFAIRTIIGKSLLGLNRPDLVTHAAIVDIVANFVLNVVLIWQYGIVGAAIGTTVSMTIGTIHRTYYLSRLINIRVPYKQLGWTFISSIGMFLALYGAKSVVEVNNYFRLVGFILLGVILYTILVLVYPPLRRDVIKQASAIIR